MLEGWNVHRLADGVGLFPPNGMGSVRIRDRRRPIRSARVVRQRALASLGPIQETGELERIATDEGEYAALATTRIAAGEHSLGVIFGDDFYTQLDFFTASPSEFDEYRRLARELTATYSLGLGSDRCRRPLYTPPTDWVGYPRGLVTTWYPIGFPKNRTAITANHAMPLNVRASSLSELVSQRRAVGTQSSDLVGSHVHFGALHGTTSELEKNGVLRVQVELRDDRYVYGFRLECPLDRARSLRKIFEKVLVSVETIPVPRRADHSAFSCWA